MKAFRLIFDMATGIALVKYCFKEARQKFAGLLLCYGHGNNTRSQQIRQCPLAFNDSRLAFHLLRVCLQGCVGSLEQSDNLLSVLFIAMQPQCRIGPVAHKFECFLLHLCH